jgi:putative membrane protein
MPLAFLNIHDLPLVDAVLNGIATILLITGFILIRNKRIQAHRRVMISAFIVSCVFLACYLVHHYYAGLVRFEKPGLVKTVYLWILGTHTILAAITPVLAIITLRRGLLSRFKSHRAIARWTFPIWLYVSVTGVIVYVLLYQVEPRL